MINFFKTNSAAMSYLISHPFEMIKRGGRYFQQNKHATYFWSASLIFHKQAIVRVDKQQRGLSKNNQCFKSISRFFIWQAIVRGQSVSTEGPFLWMQFTLDSSNFFQKT